MGGVKEPCKAEQVSDVQLREDSVKVCQVDRNHGRLQIEKAEILQLLLISSYKHWLGELVSKQFQNFKQAV